MPTFERRIDALGGTPPGEGASRYDDGYHDGHFETIRDATAIAAAADALITELAEALEAITDPSGRHSMKALAEQAEALLDRVRQEMK